MGVERVGRYTYRTTGVAIAGTGSVVGPKEGQGPLRAYFDRVWDDEIQGETSFERAERRLLQESQEVALDRAHWAWDDVDAAIGGDLLDQIVSTNFAGRQHGRPLLGLFSACAVFTEALGLGAILLSSAPMKRVLVSAVSHHMAAERQFRYPIELGVQRSPTAAWTATAAGSAALQAGPGELVVESVTFGRVVDFGSKDPNDMGSAMAPAAFDTIARHLEDTKQRPQDYDAIYTGDLGDLGIRLLEALGDRQDLPLAGSVDDCGRSLYDLKRQDVHNGGSGPGCSAGVFCGPLAKRLEAGDLNRLLLVATGALFSPTTYQQGDTIPCIAHAVAIQRQSSKEGIP